MLLEEELDSVSDGDDETSSSVEEEMTWIQWHCSQASNELFCEVDRTFIEDNFNLFGIRNLFRPEDYTAALETILDKRGRAT